MSRAFLLVLALSGCSLAVGAPRAQTPNCENSLAVLKAVQRKVNQLATEHESADFVNQNVIGAQILGLQQLENAVSKWRAHAHCEA